MEFCVKVEYKTPLTDWHKANGIGLKAANGKA
jgi:hypothetical protein